MGAWKLRCSWRALPPAPPPLAARTRIPAPLRPPTCLLPVGLDRTWIPPTAGISSPTLQLMWLLPVLSCNLSLQRLSVPLDSGLPKDRDYICSVHCPQVPRTRKQSSRLHQVGGQSQQSHELHKTSASFSHGLLFQLFKEKSLVLPHHLAAAPPKADSHSSRDMCQALTSFPTTESSPATHCILSPLGV